MAKSALEEALALQFRALKLDPLREFRFHPTRKWRFDFAWPEKKLAVEVEGGIWTNGAHTRGKHFESDCEKYGEALLLGWTVYRTTGGLIKSGKAIHVIEQLLEMKACA